MAPNSLWHVDGYHKLISWRYVIHGGIDGFSLLIMFMKVTTNNQAETVLRAFVGAVNEFLSLTKLIISFWYLPYCRFHFSSNIVGRSWETYGLFF